MDSIQRFKTNKEAKGESAMKKEMKGKKMGRNKASALPSDEIISGNNRVAVEDSDGAKSRRVQPIRITADQMKNRSAPKRKKKT